MQSQNGINSDSDRRALDKEFQQLKNALNIIAYKTEAFNRLPLLGDNDLLSDNVSSIGDTFVKGSPTRLESGLRSIAYIPAGSTNISIDIDSFSQDDDLQVFTTSGKHLVGLSGLNMVESDVLTFENAEAALQQIDDALEYVSESRAFYGAKMNQMASALKLNDRMHEGLMASRSQILDTDFAEETAKSTQAQIVEQASISVRAQA